VAGVAGGNPSAMAFVALLSCHLTFLAEAGEARFFRAKLYSSLK
jgi:hypothetical protein